MFRPNQCERSMKGTLNSLLVCFQGNNIFEQLSPDDYRMTIKYLEHAIVSTDLALYFQ